MYPDIRLEEDRNWFALYTRPRHEFKAALQLSMAEVQYYLPTVIKLKQWSDRKKKIEEPVLRGYIFIYATEKERLTSLEQNAVVKCVYDVNKKKPAVIPQWQMDNLKNFLAVRNDFYEMDGLIPGEKVKITDGPFAGIVGVLKEVEEGKSFTVSLDLLNRSVITHIPNNTSFTLIRDEIKK